MGVETAPAEKKMSTIFKETCFFSLVICGIVFLLL